MRFFLRKYYSETKTILLLTTVGVVFLCTIGCRHGINICGIYYSEEYYKNYYHPISEQQLVIFSDSSAVISVLYDTSFYHTDYYILRNSYFKVKKSSSKNYDFSLIPISIDPLNLPYEIKSKKLKDNKLSTSVIFNNLYNGVDWFMLWNDTLYNIKNNITYIDVNKKFVLLGVYNCGKYDNIQDTIMTKPIVLSDGYRHLISLDKKYEGVMFYDNNQNIREELKILSTNWIYTLRYRCALQKVKECQISTTNCN